MPSVIQNGMKVADAVDKAFKRYNSGEIFAKVVIVILARLT